MSDDHPDLPVCAGCGICCHMTVVLDPEIDVIDERLTADRNGLLCMDQHGDGACVALDPQTKLCTIYETRPSVCRIFTRGDSLCRDAVARALQRPSLLRP